MPNAVAIRAQERKITRLELELEEAREELVRLKAEPDPAPELEEEPEGDEGEEGGIFS